MTIQKAHVVGICGSLRQLSYNKVLLNHAADMLPSDIKYSVAEISEIPNYNEDLEVNPPESVIRLAQLIRSADGIIISTPEFNNSVPGVLKNALDWLSRPFVDQPASFKPVAIVGGSIGKLGTVRAQSHLRDILLKMNMDPINRPEILIPQINLKMDENGRLTDELALKLMKELIDNLVTSMKDK